MIDLFGMIILPMTSIALLIAVGIVADPWDGSNRVIIIWVMARFASPWRHARRLYWKRIYNNLPKHRKRLMYENNMDPESLIRDKKL